VNDNTKQHQQVKTFAHLAERLIEQGYLPIPCEGKRPVMRDWANAVITPNIIRSHADHNTGIVLGRGVGALDNDIGDPKVAFALEAYLHEHVPKLRDAMVRGGRVGCWTMFFACPDGTRGVPAKFDPPGGGSPVEVSLRGLNQQSVIYGTHPTPGATYAWNGGGEPLTKAVGDLPRLSADELMGLQLAVAEFMAQAGYKPLKRRGSDGGSTVLVLNKPVPLDEVVNIHPDRSEADEALTSIEGAPEEWLDLLSYADSDDRDTWVSVGMHLKAAEPTLGPLAFRLWDTWSMLAPRTYNSDDMDGRWKGFRPAYSAGIDSMYRALGRSPTERAADEFEPEGPSPDPRNIGDSAAGSAKLPSWSIPRVSLVGLMSETIAPVKFIIHGLVPIGVPTLLAAHGGTGKSYVAMQMAVCAAAGISFMGLAVERRRRTLVYTTEEPDNVVKWRLQHVCRHYGVDPDELESSGWLEIRNGYGEENNIFFTGQMNVGSRITPNFKSFRAYCLDRRFEFVQIDNISEVYDADEIVRAQVNQFVSATKSIARRGVAVMLIGHVDALTAHQGSMKGYSGSTAWHNAVRSRIFMFNEVVGKVETGRVFLVPSKANYGKKPDQMVLRFDETENLFVLVETKKGGEPMPEPNVNQVVMRAIDELNNAGVTIRATSSGPQNGVALLTKHTKLTRAQVTESILGLTLLKHVERVEYRKADRKDGFRWVLNDEAREAMIQDMEPESETTEEGNVWD
jgi:hypothetical protein